VSAGLPTSFQPEVLDFLRSEIEELGAEAVIAGLEAALMEADGQIVAEGLPAEERDGALAAGLADADAVAVALGEPRGDEDPAVLALVSPLADDLRAEPGIADLAERALAVLTDPARAEYAASPGVFPDRATLDAVAAEIAARLARAKAAYPGEWEGAGVPPGTFEVTLYD